jgi:hypothetical protein
LSATWKPPGNFPGGFFYSEWRPTRKTNLNPAIGFHCQNRAVRLKIGHKHENISQTLDFGRLGCGQWLDLYSNCR